MCLYVESKIAKKAEKDITGYKLLILAKGASGVKIFNPLFYPKLSYTLGMEAPTVTMKDYPSGSRKSRIHEGYHTYANIEDAKTSMEYRTPFHNHLAIVKCTIPKGTLYYEGKDGNNYDGFTSETITIDKVIKYNEGGRKYAKTMVR